MGVSTPTPPTGEKSRVYWDSMYFLLCVIKNAIKFGVFFPQYGGVGVLTPRGVGGANPPI